tara:strand:+ start:2355 stop:4382 length:2028 start_codon:yes stop_codon:yes gene_type:complete
MASTLKLTFNASPDLVPDQVLTVRVNTGVSILPLDETFKVFRTKNKEVQISDTYNALSTASNYTQAWNLDWRSSKGSNVFVPTVDGTEVTITLNNSSWQFEVPTGTAISSGSVSYVVANDSVVVENSVEINQYSTNSANVCGKVDVQLVVAGGNDSYNVYLDGVEVISAQSSPITVPIDRGNSTQLIVNDTNNNTIGSVLTANTRKLIPNDITAILANYSTGTTITVSATFISTQISDYDYSLDNSSFQESNVFTGQSPGTYTIYVKDGFGCVVSKDFVVDGTTTTTETVFTISNINSLRFARIQTGKKNQLNTLSYNELRLTKYPYYQQYLQDEVVTTQFKTNAQYINCFYIDKDDSVTSLTEIKKTSNIGLTEKSTSTYFNLGNGKSGIYFGVVNLLDYITDAFVETVNYGFALPQWAGVEGGLVTIDGIGQVAINRISYSETYNSFVLEFDIAYTGSPITNKIISAEYNIQPYEIYEFDTTITKDLSVVIEVGSTSSNIDFQYVSECVKKVTDSEFLFDITYWDDQNKGNMNYQTGIKNKLRLNGYQDDIGEQETEGYNGDKEFYVTDNVIYDVQKFTFKQLSTQMADKLRLVVAHKNLLINGLLYKLSEAPEVTGDGNFNLKTFSVLLKQSGEQFLTTEQENITNTTDKAELAMALASAKNKGILSWTKNY